MDSHRERPLVLMDAVGYGLALGLPEDPLDVVQFQTVGRQVPEMDTQCPQFRLCGLDLFALVDGGVVQDHHARPVAVAGREGLKPVSSRKRDQGC